MMTIMTKRLPTVEVLIQKHLFRQEQGELAQVEAPMLMLGVAKEEMEEALLIQEKLVLCI